MFALENGSSSGDANPVLVIGGGPTGLVMAAELARRGVACRIVDADRGATDKSKAIGIQARTLELFENMGIAAEFTARGNKVVAANIFHDHVPLVRLTFDELDSPFPFLLVLPQSETEGILLSHLDSLGMQVERGVRMTSFIQHEGGVTATLLHEDGRQEEVRSPWLVGCDGAHSAVRHGLDLPFHGEEYGEGFQLADVRIDWPQRDNELFAYIHDGWLLAAFPLPGGRHRLIVDLPPEKAPTDQAPSLEDLQALVDARCPVKATLSDPAWTANYRIHRRLVSRFRERRAFLVGDAAHIHSPVGAQGMNTGIQDAFNLAWKLALVTQGAADEKLLDTYHTERYPVERGVLVATDLPLKLVGLHNPLAQGARDRLLTLLSGMEFVRRRARGAISEIAVHYPRSAAVEEHALGGGPRAGERAPDGAVGDGTSARLFTLLQGPGHTMLLFAGADGLDAAGKRAEELVSAARLVRERLGPGVRIHVIRVGTDGDKRGGEPSDWLDKDGSLHKRYGARRGGVYLIRPDGYIGFRSPVSGATERLRVYLSRVYPAAGRCGSAEVL